MPNETATATNQAQTQAKPAVSQGAVSTFKPPRLGYHPMIGERFGIDRAAWIALIDAVYPLASSIDSVILALSYCRARNLDPFKRPVHIVPVWNNAARRMVDTIWPGIGELRTTAMRTKAFAGCDECKFGPDQTRAFDGMAGKQGQERQVHADVTFPEFAQLTVYRLIDGQRVAVQGPRVYWTETYASQGRSTVPNEMWQKRPRGQLEKCAEAAALRRAFPEELGEIYAAEEMEGKVTHGGSLDAAPVPVEVQSTGSQLDQFATEAGAQDAAGESEGDFSEVGDTQASDETADKPVYVLPKLVTRMTEDGASTDWPAFEVEFMAALKAAPADYSDPLWQNHAGAFTGMFKAGEKTMHQRIRLAVAEHKAGRVS